MEEQFDAEKLQEQCIEIQVLTGLDDKDWLERFGNKDGLFGLFEQYANEAREKLIAEIDDLADGLSIPSIKTWKQGKFIDSPKYSRMGERWKFEQEEREQTLIRPHGGTNNALFQVTGYVDNSVIAEYLEAVGKALILKGDSDD